MITQIRLRARMLQSKSTVLFAFVLLIKLSLFVLVNGAVWLLLKMRFGFQDETLEAAVRITAAAVLFFLSIFIFCSSSSGSARFFLKSAENGEARLKNFFYFFALKNSFKAAGFNLLLVLLRLVMLGFAFAPSALLIWLLVFLSGQRLPAQTVAIIACFALLMLWTSALFFKRMSSLLFLSTYLFSKGRGAKNSIFQSVKIMSENTTQYKKMKHSFYGWFASCVFILPVPFVWGYYKQSAAVFAQCLLFNQHLDRREQE